GGCRRAANAPGGAPLMGWLFRPARKKQRMLWLEGVTRILAQRADAHAVLIGDGPLRGEIAARLHGATCADRLHHFAAWRPAADAIAAFDVLFLASRDEGLPNVVLEAQAAGVPVVATDVGGVAEAVQADRTAILVPPQDATAESLCAAVLRALDDQALRDRTRTQGPAFIAASFAPDLMAARLLAVYNLTES